jgi:peptidoglycan/LPS O-acetylase OafA/YrhL
MTMLGDVTGARARGMDVLRLAAATLVIVAHSYVLTGHAEPLRRFGGPDFGDIAVSVFFTISGFLVTASWLSDPRLRAFLVRRALRILPGLWVVLLLTTIAAGLLVTDLTVVHYLTSLGTWRYPLERSIVFSTRDVLPGVFTGNPYGTAVNGSLWTLPLELTAYAATVGLGLAGVLARRRSLVIAATAILLVAQEVIPAPATGAAGTVSATDAFYWLVHFGLFYAAGALLYLYRSQIPLSLVAAAAGLVIWLLCFGTGVVNPVGQVALSYAVIVLAYRAPVAIDSFMRRIGDLSYGTYIYAFPVQQLVVHYKKDISALGLIAWTVPITFALAALSWHIVERPALRLRHRLIGRDRSVPTTAVSG